MSVYRTIDPLLLLFLFFCCCFFVLFFVFCFVLFFCFFLGGGVVVVVFCFLFNLPPSGLICLKYSRYCLKKLSNIQNQFSQLLHAKFMQTIEIVLAVCILSRDFESRHEKTWEARSPSGRASDSGAEVGGSILTRRGVSLSKVHLPPKRTDNTQEAVAPSRHDLKIVNLGVKQKRNGMKTRKPGFPTMSDTNRAVRPQKMYRGLKLRI